MVKKIHKQGKENFSVGNIYEVVGGWDDIPAIAKTLREGGAMPKEKIFVERVSMYFNLSCLNVSSSNFPTGRATSCLWSGLKWPLLVGHEKCGG